MTVVARVQVQTQVRQGDAPKDYVDNTLWFSTEAAAPTTAFQALTDMISGIWKLNNPPPTWGPFNGRGHQIRAYQMSDTVPRPIIAQTSYTPGLWATISLNPRQIALCLSYYSERNLPRQRGRVYIGPFDTTWAEQERPVANEMAAVLDLGRKLNAGALALSPVWLHGIWSERAGTFYPATDYWCNDIYDTVRRRTPKESTRQRLHP
jgi:hypothetical protein